MLLKLKRDMESCIQIDCRYAGADVIGGLKTPSDDELCWFLARYSARLLGCGATCIRLQKNVVRIAQTYGRRVGVYIMPRHVHITVWKEGQLGHSTMIASVRHNTVSFSIISKLSELSWRVADSHMDFGSAVEMFERIVHTDHQSQWLVLLLVSLAGAAFCRLFGGDVLSMLVVALGTALGYSCKLLMLRRKIDGRATVFTCAFLSTLVTSYSAILPIGFTYPIAVGTGILYLVPGIPFLNSFSDLIYRHYICAFSRFIDAVVMTACLSGGLCAALWLLNVNVF